MGALSNLASKAKDASKLSIAIPTGGGMKSDGFQFLLGKIQDSIRYGLDPKTNLLVALEFDESIQDKSFMDFMWVIVDKTQSKQAENITVFDISDMFGYKDVVSYEGMSWTKDIKMTHPVVQVIPFIDGENCSNSVPVNNLCMVNGGGGPGYSVIELEAGVQESEEFVKWIRENKNKYLKSVYLFTPDGAHISVDGEAVDTDQINTGERRWFDGMIPGDDPSDFSDKFFLWMFRKRDSINALTNFISIICIDKNCPDYMYQLKGFNGSVHDFYEQYDPDFARTLAGWTYDMPVHIPLSVMALYTNCNSWNMFSFEKGSRIVHFYYNKGYICIEMQGVASELVPLFSAFASNCNEHVMSVRLYDTEGNRYLMNGRGRVSYDGSPIDDVCGGGPGLKYDDHNGLVLIGENGVGNSARVGCRLKIDAVNNALFRDWEELTEIRYTDFGTAELVFGMSVQPLVSLKSFEVEPIESSIGKVCVVPANAGDCSKMTLQNKNGNKVMTGSLIRLTISDNYVSSGWLTSGNTYKLQAVYMGTDGQYWATIDGVEVPVFGIEDFDIVM